MPGDETGDRDQRRGEPSQGVWENPSEETVFSGTPVALGAEELRVDPASPKVRRVRYALITHMDSSRRGLAIATSRRAILIRRERFADDDAIRSLVQALRGRIGQRQPAA